MYGFDRVFDHLGTSRLSILITYYRLNFGVKQVFKTWLIGPVRIGSTTPDNEDNEESERPRHIISKSPDEIACIRAAMKGDGVLRKLSEGTRPCKERSII